MRIIKTLLISICVATLLTELFGLAMLWSSGNLDAEMLDKMQAVLTGKEVPTKSAAAPEPAPELTPEEKIVQVRAVRFRDLEQREHGVNVRADFVEQARRDVTQEREELMKLREQFQTRLDQLVKEAADEGLEQERAILAKLDPAQAKALLLMRETDDVVRLLSGMPEKASVKILGEFESPDERNRADEILRGLEAGGPKGELGRELQEKLKSIAAERQGGQ